MIQMMKGIIKGDENVVVVAEVGAIVDGKGVVIDQGVGIGMKVVAVGGVRIVEVEVGMIIQRSIHQGMMIIGGNIDACMIIIANIMTIVKDHQARRDPPSLRTIIVIMISILRRRRWTDMV